LLSVRDWLKISRAHMRPDSTAAGGGAFQQTRWSLVVAASQPDSTQAQAALARLCELYWYPVYAFLRRRGYDPHRAKDLTQELFAQMIEKSSFKVAEKERGRFRSFLLASLRHLLSHEYRREHAAKRGGEYTFVPLDEALGESRYGAEPIDPLSPEKLFERRWALTLLDQAMDDLKREYAETGREEQFDALHPFITGAADSPASYAEIARRLNLNENAARQAAFRLRTRFGDLLRARVALTVASPEELEPELRQFRLALCG
jgi:RNA polymerase sigma factor (sigma-70 family)